MFSTTKLGHVASLLTTCVLGDSAIATTTPLDADDVQKIGSLVLQVIVTIVTIFATVRKMRQAPLTVVPTSPSPTPASE